MSKENIIIIEICLTIDWFTIPQLLDEDEEKAMLQGQVEALQMGKDVMGREMEALKVALAKATAQKDEAAAAASEAANRLAAVTEDNAALKLGLDEARSEARVASEKAKVLETVLEQRSNGDDVQVLRSELHNVQKVGLAND